MECSKCGRPGVIFQDYSGMELCKQHFKDDVLHKTKKTVRQNNWLVPGRRYAISLSGWPSSCALLDFMDTLIGARKDISLVAITIKTNDNHKGMENAKEIAESDGIPWFFGLENQNNRKTEAGPGSDATSQSPFRGHELMEYHLAVLSEQYKIDVLALGYTLEDHAEWVFWQAISEDAAGKRNNATGSYKRVRIIRPFMHVPEIELKLYSRLFLEGFHGDERDEGNDCVSDSVRTDLAQVYHRHPGVPYALVNIGKQIKKFRDHRHS